MEIFITISAIFLSICRRFCRRSCRRFCRRFWRRFADFLVPRLFPMQDLNSEIDVIALQGEDGIRKKLEEFENCFKLRRYKLARRLLPHYWARTSCRYLDEQLRRLAVMCEKEKCANIDLLVKLVEKTIEYNGTSYDLFKPQLTLMDNGQFVRWENHEDFASPQFAEFYILSLKKAGKLFEGRRLENHPLEDYLEYAEYLPIELLLLLLRYGAGMGDPIMNPEKILGMLLANLMAAVFSEENFYDVSPGDRDCRKLSEMVHIVKKTFVFNFDVVSRYFEKYIFIVEDMLPFPIDDMPKVEECFQILERKGLVNRKELFQIPSLKQMCKVKIRETLNQKWELPEGIDKLEGIPRTLQCYLNLKTD